MATAAAADAGDAGDARICPRYVTASLSVNFLRPTPLGPELELRAWVKERRGRKTVVEVEISALGEIRARGEVVAVPMPTTMKPA